MKEKIKRIFKLILKIFEFPNVLFLCALILFVLYWKDFFNIINIELVFLLSPFLLIFLAIFIKKRDDKSFLTIASILLIILIFLFQSFEMNKNKINYIKWINEYNCNNVIASCINLERLEDKSSQYIPSGLILNPYKEDMYFIYNKFGEELKNAIIYNLNNMEILNSHITTVKELNTARGITNDLALKISISKQIKEHNSWIIQISKEINENFCQKLF